MPYGDKTPSWTEAQLLTASRIIHQVRMHGVPEVAILIALTVAIDESDLLCLSSDARPDSKLSVYAQGDAQGDATSVGAFQQQDPWGSIEDRMNPYGATQRFLTGGDGPGCFGLLHLHGWASLDPAQAATDVQHNRDGAAPYRPAATRARGLVRVLAARS